LTVKQLPPPSQYTTTNTTTITVYGFYLSGLYFWISRQVSVHQRSHKLESLRSASTTFYSYDVIITHNQQYHSNDVILSLLKHEHKLYNSN